MTVMLEVLSDLALHIHAAEGFKKVGQPIDLHGGEDAEVCREAGVLWNERTTDRYPNMRAKINAEFAAIADEFHAAGRKWCERHVLRLITFYRAQRKVDEVLENLGEDFYHDPIHSLENGDATEIAED